MSPTRDAFALAVASPSELRYNLVKPSAKTVTHKPVSSTPKTPIRVQTRVRFALYIPTAIANLHLLTA